MTTRFSCKLLSVTLAAGAVLALSVPAAQAGLISLSADTLSASGAEITGGATTTESVLAWNVMDDDGADVTVQGVTFATDQPSSVAVDFGETPGGTGTNADTGANYTGNMVKVMEAVLVTDDADGGNPAIGTVTISGLVAGQQYRVQMLHHHDIGNTDNARRMQVYFGNQSTGTSTGFFNVGDSQGYITTADFTADGSSQLFTLASIAGESERATLNGLALFAVPEPGSLALLGLGGFAMLARRRKA